MAHHWSDSIQMSTLTTTLIILSVLMMNSVVADLEAASTDNPTSFVTVSSLSSQTTNTTAEENTTTSTTSSSTIRTTLKSSTTATTTPTTTTTMPTTTTPSRTLNENCTKDDECINNLNCTSNKCACQQTHYYNDSMQNCDPKINYSDRCPANTNDVCLDNTTACLNPPDSSAALCLCKPSFYRTNSSICQSDVNLKINLNEPVKRGTTYMTFYWDDMSNRTDIQYTISVNGEKHSPTNTKSRTNATSLTPGSLYDISLKSTLPKNYYYKEVIKETNYTNWTFPAKPGEVISHQLLSSSNGIYNYTIIFNASEGNVKHYYIQVNISGSSKIPSESTSVVFTLDPYTRYSYIITSVNGILEESEQRTGTFQTDTAVSDPVENLTISGSSSSQINITWKAPKKANGNISGYYIKVNETDRTCKYSIIVVCNNSTPHFDPTCNLKPNVTKDCNGDVLFELELTELSIYTNYIVEVQAVNEEKLGKPKQVPASTTAAAANSVSSISIISTRDPTNRTITLYINWVPGNNTGPTNYSYIVEEVGTNNTRSGSNIGFNNTSYVWYNVRAAWTYQVSVNASTDIGGPSVPFRISNKTVENNPGPVQNLSVTQDLKIARKVNVVFVCPSKAERNGIITAFTIRWFLKNNNSTLNYFNSTTDCSATNYSFSIEEDFIIEQDYSFNIMVLNKYEGEWLKDLNVTIRTKVPNLPATDLVKKVGETEETKFTIEVCARSLTNDSQGTIINAGIIVCASEKCGTNRKKREESQILFVNYTHFGDAKKNDFAVLYRATPDNWLANISGRPNAQFTIGDNSSCSTSSNDYCNGPLPTGREIKIKVIACTKAGCDIVDSVDSYQLKVPPNDNTGAIVGGIFGALAFIVIVCVIIFLIRRNTYKKPKRHSTEIDAIPERDKIKLKRPIRMRNFNEHVTKYHRDSNLLFQDEFENIQTLCKAFTFSSEHAKLEANRVKNRYVDIIPYDYSRVKLDILPDDDETKDFINANYIPGFNSVREYIATQGPMYSTIPDFWRMAWEQKCKVIVMLSDLMETGKRKVDLYWPENLNEPINYEHVVVEMTNFSQLNNYIIRNFKVTKGNEVRKMTHFFLPGWSDFSADVGLDVVLGFVRLIRQEATPANPGPIIVHCSAGVGRTGTLIALDYFTQFVQKHNLDEELDVFDFVMQMRKNRCRMVQVESQYIFIYDAINKAIQQKIKAEEERLYENNLSNGVYANMAGQQEENIYQNSNVKEDKYVYNNEAFEPDFSNIENSSKNDKPTTEL